MTDDLRRWLERLGLAQYAEGFEDKDLVSIWRRSSTQIYSDGSRWVARHGSGVHTVCKDAGRVGKHENL